MPTSRMTLNDLEAIASKDRAFTSAIKKLDSTLLADSLMVMECSFRNIWKAEHSGDSAGAGLHADIFFKAARAAFRHLDETGVSSSIARLSAHVKDFDFVANLPALAYDHYYLVKVLGVPNSKATAFWKHVEVNKHKVLKALSKSNFRLEVWAEVGRRRFFGSGGEDWEHMSPGLWRRAAGGALIVANCALFFGSAAIGSGLAIASCAAGSAGVLL